MNEVTVASLLLHGITVASNFELLPYKILIQFINIICNTEVTENNGGIRYVQAEWTTELIIFFFPFLVPGIESRGSLPLSHISCPFYFPLRQGFIKLLRTSLSCWGWPGAWPLESLGLMALPCQVFFLRQTKLGKEREWRHKPPNSWK